MEVKLALDTSRIHMVKVDELMPFQGELKDLSNDNYERLSKEILETGFAFPIFAWEHNGAWFTIDGHQRLRTLKTMRDLGGITIPDELPVISVLADNAVLAKERILQASSMYGTMSEQGLYQFSEEVGIPYERIQEMPLPIDVDKYVAEYYEEPAMEEPKPEKEKKPIKCPNCGFEIGNG